jgi:hypothetical protein
VILDISNLKLQNVVPDGGHGPPYEDQMMPVEPVVPADVAETL